MVEGAGHVCLQVGVAVAVAVHERAEFDSARHFGPRGELGPGLKVQAVWFTVEREEVIPVEENVNAQLLELDYTVTNDRILGMLGLKLNGNTNGAALSHDSTVSRGSDTTKRSLRSTTIAERIQRPERALATEELLQAFQLFRRGTTCGSLRTAEAES